MSADNRSLMEKMKDDMVPGVISGVIAVAGASMMFGASPNAQIPIMGYSLPVWGVVGGSVAIAVSSSEFVHDMIVEKIPQLQSIGNIENRVMAPLLSGIATFGLISTTISPDVSIINSAGLGAVSSIGGRYAFSMIQDKM